MFSGASGSRPSPLKIAGREIRRMEELSVAARMPTVVTESATRRSWAAEWSTRFLSFVSHPNYSAQPGRPGAGDTPLSVEWRLMTVQPIRLFGDPVLRTPADEVTDF